MPQYKYDVILVGMRFYKPTFDLNYEIHKSPLVLEREPCNVHDNNAIAVLIRSETIGHLNRESASKIAPLMDAGVRFSVLVIKVSSRTIKLRLISSKEYIEILPPNLYRGNSPGIYIISCGKITYIGQSNKISERLRAHWKSLSSGSHPNKHLQRCWDENGADNFDAEIVEIPNDDISFGLQMQRWLAERERHWIDYYKKNSINVNILEAEIVETKRAIADLKVEERAHDLWVREEKNGFPSR